MSLEDSQKYEGPDSEVSQDPVSEAVVQDLPKKPKSSRAPVFVVGAILLLGLLPIGDVDGDGTMDVAGKWLMLQVMTGQEKSKVVKPFIDGEVKQIPRTINSSGGAGLAPAM